MPSSTTSGKRSAFTRAANSRSRGTDSAISVGELSQPRRFAIFCRVAASRLQVDVPRRKSPTATVAAAALALRTTEASGPGEK
jgi:hypothetical protein